MGGALAVAAGLASPPLAAVILPGASIFGSSGKSPVLAFPEPHHDAVPVRVVPNGQQANSALAARGRAAKAKAETARPVAMAHPPARSIPVPNTPNTQTASDEHVTPDALRQDSLRQSIPGQRTTTPLACTPGLLSVDKPCAAAQLEQLPPVANGLMRNPSRVLTPVSIPVQLSIPVKVPVQVPVPVSLPVRIEVPIPILQPIPIGKKTQLERDTHAPKDTPFPVDPQGWGEKARDTGR
jgi:hypothetical protein